MKKILLHIFVSLLLLTVSVFGFGQGIVKVPKGLNYEAIARDDNGFPIIKKNIVVVISILSALSPEKIEWEEVHSLTTSESGFFSLVIGEGISTSKGILTAFDKIDWSKGGNYYMKVQVDFGASLFGNGLNYMGTVKLQSVPYAFMANRSWIADSAINVKNKTLAELIGVTESKLKAGQIVTWTGTKWNVQDLTVTDYLKRDGSTDLTNDWTIQSKAIILANGYLQSKTLISGTMSSTTVNATQLFSKSLILNNTQEVTNISVDTTLGGTNPNDKIIATQRAIKRYIDNAGTSGFWNYDIATKNLSNKTDIGWGNKFAFYGAKSAFRAGHFTTETSMGYYSAGFGFDNEINADYGFASGSGNKLDNNALRGFAVGKDNQIIGVGGVAFGQNNVVYGYASIAFNSFDTIKSPFAGGSADHAVAMGYDTNAGADASLAGGYQTETRGVYSVALGYQNKTGGSADASFAMGNGNQTTGKYSCAFGVGSKSNSYSEVVMGRYNLNVGGDPVNWVGTDRLFVLGNGSSNINRADALTVYKNGNALFAGTVTAVAFTPSSDMRFKKDIYSLGDVMPKLMTMQGVYYHWKTDQFKNRGFNNKRQIGFIAQDLEKIFPELVFKGEDGYLSVDYQKVTAILVEAVKKQQLQINELKSENEILKKNNENINELKTRMDDMEKLLRKQYKNVEGYSVEKK